MLLASWGSPPWGGAASAILTAPFTEDPEGEPWDVLARTLGTKDRNAFISDRMSIDVEGTIFAATDDVESEIYQFCCRSDIEDHELSVELTFSGYVQSHLQQWCVFLDHCDNLSRLQKHLCDLNSPIRIVADCSVLEEQKREADLTAAVHDEQLRRVLDILSDHDDLDLLQHWSALPKMPVGWAFIRFVHGWLDSQSFDHTQVSFLLWLFEGRSREAWKTFDAALSAAMTNAVEEVLGSEFSGYRGSPGHGRGNPEYLRWKSSQSLLQKELKWLLDIRREE
jgi:hypothetical protein